MKQTFIKFLALCAFVFGTMNLWAISGSDTEASQGDFDAGYDYEFTTEGTTVTITFTLKDDKDGVLCYFWDYTNGFKELSEYSIGKTGTWVFTDQTIGSTLSFACKFAFAGGMAVTKTFNYEVGSDPAPVTPAAVGDTIKIVNADPEYTLFYKVTNITEGSRAVTVVKDLPNDPYHAVMPSGDIVIPDSVADEAGIKYAVTVIGDHAFYPCNNITSITLPDGITDIENYGLRIDNINLTDLRIPKQLNAFVPSYSLPRKLKKITVAEGNTIYSIIEDMLFYHGDTLVRCPYLGIDSIALPACTRYLGGSALDCTDFKIIKFNEGFTRFLSGTMQQHGIEKIYWPASLNYMYASALTTDTYTHLRDMYIAEGNTSFAIIDRSVYSLDEEGNPYSLRWVPGIDTPDPLIIPEGVTLLTEYACSNAEVSTIYLPSTLEKIADRAFNHFGQNQMGDLYIKAKQVPVGLSASVSMIYQYASNINLHLPCDTLEGWNAKLYDTNHFKSVTTELMHATYIPEIIWSTMEATDTTSCNNVEVTVTPNLGYKFDKWFDGVTDAVRVFEVVSDTVFPDVVIALDSAFSEITAPAGMENWYVASYMDATTREHTIDSVYLFFDMDGLSATSWDATMQEGLEGAIRWQNSSWHELPGGQVIDQKFFGGIQCHYKYQAYFLVDNEHLVEGAHWKIYIAPNMGKCTLMEEDLLCEGILGKGVTTAIDRAGVTEPVGVMKRLVGGQLLIERNGQTYDARGALLR